MNSQRTRDINELKRQALNFYTVNSDIPKRVEDALNSLFYDSPYDAYGYLSEFFTKYSKPSFISRIKANKSIFYDAKCQPTFRLDIYCQDKNSETKALSIEASCYTLDIINDSAKIQAIQEDDSFRSVKINEIVNFINSEINDLVKNHSPSDQEEIDEKLSKLFKSKQTQCFQYFMTNINQKERSNSQADTIEGKKSKTPTSPKQKAAKAPRKSSQVNGPNTLGFGDDLNILLSATFYPSFVEPLISKSICKCSASLERKQLFEHISNLRSNDKEKYSMPIPMITVLQNGKGFNGKQNLIKEIILYPKPNLTVHESSDIISKINRSIRDTLYQSKTQPGPVNKCVTDIGALTCSLETPQQGLELVENAILGLANENAANICIALNISASEIFDPEKNKYEIGVGTLKSADELIEVYADLISKFPRISMIIEPFRPEDQLAWYKFYLRVSKFCLVGNNIKINSNVDLKDMTNSTEKFDDDKQNDLSKVPDILKPVNPIYMAVNFLKYDNSINVTGMCFKLKEIESKRLYTGLMCNTNETDDSFISDLAVANQVRFLRIGGFNRSERVSKLNRLIEIEAYLAENKKLLDPKLESRDLGFSSDLEIPSEYFEAIQNPDDGKGQKAGKK